jgi:membrane fusion protein, multidrug efflux system
MAQHTENTVVADKPSASLPNQEPSGGNRWWKWLLVAAIVAAGAFFFLRHQAASLTGQAAAPPAPDTALTVTTASARKGDLGVYVDALGTVTPVYTVTVTSRVVGQIVSVNYQEGQLVHKGDSLLEIDPRPYQAALTQVQGQLAHDQGVLNEARIDVERYQQAFARNAIAKQLLDDQQQVVTQDEGTVGNDQGQVENAKLNLAYCHITSPIDGRVGLRLVDPGNIVQANGTTPLVVITQLQPITVIFSVAEDYLPQIQEQLRQGHRLQVDVFDRTQQKQIATGALLTLDNQIDTTTGTIRLKAIFDNKDTPLFPNQFVNAKLLVTTQRGATLIPSGAVQRNGQGAFVYQVNKDHGVSLHTITVGTTDGNTTAVQGLNPGDVIAVDNFDKLQDGMKVAVRENTGGGNQRAAQ